MFNLIRKDLLMHKSGFQLWAPVFVGVLAWQAWRGFSPSFFLMLACVYGTIFPALLVTIEDKSRSGAFNCSLPVTRRQVVGAKYIISWALAVFFTSIGLMLYSVIAADSFLAIWSTSTAGQALVTLSLGLGLTLPLSLRFGFWGFTGAFVVTTSLGMGALLVLQVVSPDLHIMDSFIAISDFVARVRAQLRGPLFLTAIIVAGAVLNVVSCEIAVVLFKRREFG
ncbi:MAG: ABC-2 transporter permease [Pirellulaceae bacterium]|nr:ABC-2 transporter permease [Pirellulaceae bacterium]